MKTIKVAAAIILDEGKIFATQRRYGEFAGDWEFPGGKLEPGESAEAAVVREIKEELGVVVEPLELFDTVEYDYPNFHLSMDCFICQIKEGRLELREHSAAKWLTKETLDSVNWLEADQGLVEKLKVLLD